MPDVCPNANRWRRHLHFVRVRLESPALQCREEHSGLVDIIMTAVEIEGGGHLLVRWRATEGSGGQRTNNNYFDRVCGAQKGW